MAPLFTLYGNRGSASAERVTLMLMVAEFPATDYELVTMDPGNGSLKSPEYLSKHPYGRVPALVMPDGFILYESRKILFRRWLMKHNLDIITNSYRCYMHLFGSHLQV
jgi:glutathione S-transferase